MQPISQPSVRNYNNVGTRNNGFQYRIMPLAFNLQLRGNGPDSCIVTRCIFNIGDNISGICSYDKKQHTGKVVNIVFDTEDDPLILYVMDSKNRMVLPIQADTAKILSKKVLESYSFDTAISRYTKTDNSNNKINNKNDVSDMNKNIKFLVEDYFSGTEQMNMSIKNQAKAQRKADKAYEGRQQFLITVLGKATYNKYAKKENFAPIPMSALHIMFNDLYYLFMENNVKMRPMDNADGIGRVNKLILFLNSAYVRNEFKLIDNGIDYNVHTNLVFKSLDDIIDFLQTLQKGVSKITKVKDPQINWKMIIKKFRDYLK